MKNKRGQVTIFIIIAVLIVAGVALFLILRGGIGQKEVYSPEIIPIKNFVDECLYETLEQGIYTIGQQGGYSEIQDVSTSDGVSYYVFAGKKSVPLKMQVKEELEDYVYRKFFLCSLSFVDFPEYDIEDGNFELTTTIQNERVVLKVKYPLTIRKGEAVSRIETFKVEIPARLGIVYDSVEEFMQTFDGENICLSCLGEISQKNEVEINLLNSYNSTTLFSFKDEQTIVNDTELDWRFALQLK